MKHTCPSQLTRYCYYHQGREWEYKFIKPCIIAEQYMVDESGSELKDYKFFCFNGQPKMLYVASNRAKNVYFDFFDMDFNRLPIRNLHDNSPNEIDKPNNFAQMKEIAGILSKDMPHVRVDLYNANGKIYFGELTFYHMGAAAPFVPEEWDKRIGDWLVLPQRK